MAGRMTHAEIEELLGAYALDAVEGGERDELEAHVVVCPRCAWEVTSHREVAAALAHAGSPAPEGVWDRIAGSLVEAPPALDLSRVASSGASRGRRRGAAIGLVAAAAAVTAFLSFEVVRQEQRVNRITDAMEQRGLEQAAASVSADAKAQRVTLRSDDGGIFAQTAVQQDGISYLVRHNLPQLPEGRTYQLWGSVGTRNVSLGVLGQSPGVVAFTVSGEVTTVAVTEEESGGSISPTGRPVVRGFLPDA
jgi:Anti-sigma-K factor rskA/Putative zinc-finger